MFDRPVNCVLVDGKEVGLVTYRDPDNEDRHIVRFNTLKRASVERSRLEIMKGHLRPFDFGSNKVRDSLMHKRALMELIDFSGDEVYRITVDVVIDQFMLDKEDGGYLCVVSNGKVKWAFNAIELANNVYFLDRSPCATVEVDRGEEDE